MEPTAQTLALLSDPRVGDITFNKPAPTPGWAAEAFPELATGPGKARMLHVLARDGVTYHCLEFDTLQELVDGLPQVVDAVNSWPEEAAIPPGS